MDISALPLAAFILTAIGWISRELWRWRNTKRQAAYDASKTLSDKKKLLEEMISKIEDVSFKQTLLIQLDEVNAALLGLYAKRLRQTLRDADLPPEETLIDNGRRQLQPKQRINLKKVITQVKALPTFLSTKDLFVLGNAYYYMEQYEDAKNIYDRILNMNPNDPDTLFNRGTTYGRLEEYDNALADFNHSLELRPDDPGTLNNRGLTYRLLERYDESLVDLNRSLELRPDDPVTLHNRGNTSADLRRYEEALADMNRSLELRPDYPDTLIARGIIYAELGRYEEALTDLNRSLKLKPDYSNVFYCLACVFSLWRKTDDALSYLKKAIDKDKKFREIAKSDENFDNMRDHPRFKKLIESD